jgi:hypothetical protein
VKLAGGPANSSRFPNPAAPPASEIGRQGRVVTTVSWETPRLICRGQTVGGVVHGKTYAPVARKRATSGRAPLAVRVAASGKRRRGGRATWPLARRSTQVGTVAPSPAAFLPSLSGPHDHMAGPCVPDAFPRCAVWMAYLDTVSPNRKGLCTRRCG